MASDTYAFHVHLRMAIIKEFTREGINQSTNKARYNSPAIRNRPSLIKEVAQLYIKQ